MKTALLLIFWGYLFVLLRFEVVIDLLPDPLGYLLIALGCFKLLNQFPIAKNAAYFSVIMIFISLPTLFLSAYEVADLGWTVYSSALLTLQLILVYFLFSILKVIAKNDNNEALIKKTQRTSTIYIALNLVILAFSSFSMNVSGIFWEVTSLVLLVAGLTMEIVFLILVWNIRRITSKEKKPV